MTEPKDNAEPSGASGGSLAQRWIPVCDRLPEEMDEDGCFADVLGFFPEYPPSIAIVWWNGSRWEDTEGFVKAPTHWMPLPAPPTDSK